jgi:hypothetical protein
MTDLGFRVLFWVVKGGTLVLNASRAKKAATAVDRGDDEAEERKKEGGGRGMLRC